MPEKSLPPLQTDIFDLIHSPITGVNLIDASAGTGKTYTICGLVLRLLLEKHLNIEQILVVTYTEAATEDLRNRIRQQLLDALTALSAESSDEFLKKYMAEVKEPQSAAQRLSEALRSFDEAAIFTIHGFCQRMLHENSFESNSLFDTELVTDDSYLIKEIIEDFWRRASEQFSSLFSQYCAAELTPESFYDFLLPLLPHPFIRLTPEIDFDSGCGSLSGPEKKYCRAFADVCREWLTCRQEISNVLLHSPKLNRNKYNTAAVTGLINGLDTMAGASEPSPHLPDKFPLLTSGSIRSGTKKNQSPDILKFNELCQKLWLSQQELLLDYNNCLFALKKKLMDFLQPELKSRKARDNVFYFDDLLRRLHEALKGSGGAFLAQSIARKFPAALIDEFQDTDPLQYEIIKTIYREDCLLFLIGDPKQAIYSFRGADIHTYLDAAAGFPVAHHTLGVNYRSAPALVHAVNTIFSRAVKPFIYDTISFQPVAAAPQKADESLSIDGKQEAPLFIWYLAGNDDSDKSSSASDSAKRISKTDARSHIISRVTAEISRLLQLAAEKRLYLNDRTLVPADIAVLVRKNEEARKMQESLAGVNITSVLQSGESLFTADEARDMKLLLASVSAPNNIRKLKTALLTRLIGITPDDIVQLPAGNAAGGYLLEDWMNKFRNYHELWNRYGFMRMFWTFMQENRVRHRLLQSENGERTLTNYLHLAEILHQEEINLGYNMSALQDYLRNRMSEDHSKSTEHQLRLESDEDRVKIVTIHKAKGLQYPVVFCPFTWEGTRLTAKKGVFFHRPSGKHQTELVYDTGSPELDFHLQQARQEELSENLRMLYVALTRAVNRCYLFWGPINGAESSAPAYLLHQEAPNPDRFGNVHADPAVLMQETAARFLNGSEEEILADLTKLANASKSSLSIITDELEPETYHRIRTEPLENLTYRKSTAVIPGDWKISSFSSLTASSEFAATMQNHLFQDDGADRDKLEGFFPAVEELSSPKTADSDIFSFPKGTKPGIFLHELLEQADFSSTEPVAESLISEKLIEFNYETSWLHVLKKMLNDLVNVPLLEKSPGLKLANVPLKKCLHELEFYFPVTRITTVDLQHIFNSVSMKLSNCNTGKSLGHQVGRLVFSPSRGFMRGFIDLVFEHEGKFYLADWKSNHLGSNIESYSREKLCDAMISGYYFLQYHLYCLALHLYLESRLPDYDYDSHFGGVFYVFLRGLRQELGPDYGIYFDLPPFAVIQQLRQKILAA